MDEDTQRLIRRLLATWGDAEGLNKDLRELQRGLIEAEAQADANFRLYALTEKYHNEDMLLMQEMEKVIAEAKRVVSGPDSVNYAALSDAIDNYERARRERDRTY